MSDNSDHLKTTSSGFSPTLAGERSAIVALPNGGGLAQRGIADAARAMGWQAGKDGWDYHVYDPTGAPIAHRWKAYDSAAKPKYQWLDGTNGQYYHVGAGLQQAIIDAGGVLYIANGEPAVLTFHAAGQYNVLSFFGESHAPETLAADLLALGVATVRYYPDKDQPGQRAAIKLRDRLQGSGIDFDCRTLPDELPPKADTNDLWQRLQFDPQAFRAALDDAPAYDLPAPAPIIRQHEFTRETTGIDRRDEFINTVVLPDIERTASRHQGKHFQCINPDHADEHPSARIGNGRSGNPVYFCTCGTYSLTTVGKWLGLNYRQWLRDNYPTHKPKKSIRRRLKQAANPRRGAVRVQHVSDDLKPANILAPSTLLIQAPTGLGKSFAITGAINTLPDAEYITAIAQFRLLTSALYELLPKFAHYEQADAAHQRALGQLKRLVTSLSSLAKFDRQGGRVMVDEITGVLKFLAESSTFRSGEALAAFRALVRLLETAAQVIGMDANLDEITIHFIEKYRGKVTVKRYERAEPRGQVTLLRDQAAAVCTLEKLLSHRRGQVDAACSSEKTASEVADYFAGLGYRVLKVTRDTSNTAQVKRASVDPNTRQTYDLIVYDSSWGAGVDIAERVYAQVCIFDRLPLAPEDAIQLVGRVRDAERRYAAVIGDGDGYPTPSADELLADILKRERWTSATLNSTPQDAGDMFDLAQLWAQFKARQLRETARWRYYFTRRLQADGFTVTENNAHAPETFREAWKQWKAERDDQHWQTILTIDQPLPDDELDTLRLAGVEITGELRLRNVRWHIEGAKAVSEVTDQDRDLMKERGRHRLFHLRDWLGDIDDLRAVDQAQADEGRPIHQRRYSTLTRAVITELFRLMEHEGTPEQQLMGFIDAFRDSISAPDVAARYGMVTSPEAMSKFKALGHYGNNAVTVTGLCRWLLEYFGLKLNSQRHRVEGELTMFYQVDSETLDYRLERAQTAARRRETVIRNVYSSLKYTKVISPSHAPSILSKDATGQALPGESGDGYTTYAGALTLAQNMRELGIARWKDVLPV